MKKTMRLVMLPAVLSLDGFAQTQPELGTRVAKARLKI